MRRLAHSFALLGLAACGGAVDGGTRSATPGPGSTGGGGAADGGMGGGGVSGTGGAGGAGTGGVPYVDPGCPPPTTTVGTYECDPFALTSCGPGYRCTPYVFYADDCGSEEIGTACVVSGSGVQGDDCATLTCSAGYVCASGGTGLECMRLCEPGSGANACQPGLVCHALDVDGFYVCS